jgi:hypothetical protein
MSTKLWLEDLKRKPAETSRFTLGDNTKMHFRETGCGDVN